MRCQAVTVAATQIRQGKAIDGNVNKEMERGDLPRGWIGAVPKGRTGASEGDEGRRGNDGRLHGEQTRSNE